MGSINANFKDILTFSKVIQLLEIVLQAFSKKSKIQNIWKYTVGKLFLCAKNWFHPLFKELTSL